ncbi:MAG TPA: LD-carboxypeptidase [Candidatus Acidoferrales bacterium]
MQPSHKPHALRPGDVVRVLSLASPVQEDRLEKGCDEIKRLGYTPQTEAPAAREEGSFFADSAENRLRALQSALQDAGTRAIFCSRGGYGSNYLIEGLGAPAVSPKIFLGSSDITSLQAFLWQKLNWVTFYGPMVASNFDQGAGVRHGYDEASLIRALTATEEGWTLDLQGGPLIKGSARGITVGGCLTLLETTLGTPWEIETNGAILILEDRGMKPYQVDRALMHMKQAGKFRTLEGIVLGEFPDCEGPEGDETVRDAVRRVLGDYGIPIVWGAPIGHTSRPMLTIPLGVLAELSSAGSGTLRILEPACTP